MMNEILLSLHPKYWELIKSGKKTIEVRKTKPQKARPVFRVFVYVTGGVGVVGCFDCDMVIQTTPERMAKFGESCLTEAELAEYAEGKPLFGWHIAPGSIVEYEAPFELERATGCKKPPQSWQYLRGYENG